MYKKGESGNPGGRPKVANLRKVLDRSIGDVLVAEKLRAFIEGRVKGQKPAQALEAMELYLKYRYGAPTQAVEFEGQGFPIDIRTVEIVKDSAGEK